jgi:hypothetical protein
MRPTFRKLEVKDIGSLERLVADNVDGIEPGLKIVDTRLLLGQAVVDLVGLDSRDSLVLIALDLSADEGLLLRVMDAYSWCLEYPDTLRRLYPKSQVSPSRPPRVLFVVERFSDAFLRRVKQLSFLEVDCFEFRHLEVNGASVVYFDSIERLRKSAAAVQVEAAPPAITPAPMPVRARVEPVVSPVEHPARVEPAPRIEPAPRVEAVVPPVEPVAPRVEPASPRVERPTLMVGAARVEPTPTPAAPTPSVETFVPEPAVAVTAVPAPQPSARLVGTTPVEAATLARELIEPAPASPALQLEAIEATAALAAADSANDDILEWTPPLAPEAAADVAPSVPSVKPAPAEIVAASPLPVKVEAPEPPAITIPEPIRVEPDPIVAAPAQPPVWAKPQAQPNGNRPHFFAQAAKGPSPAEPNGAVAAPAPPPAAKPALEVDDRPELESLSFPKDGLSRQWLEFLSQLGATK